MPPTSTSEGDLQRFATALLQSLEPIETFARRFYLGVGAVTVAFGITHGLKGWAAGYSESARGFLLALCVSLAVFVAASAVGCLLGFLFGIPRSQRPEATGGVPAPKESRRSEASAAQSVRWFISNTSLEDISDWLTKIIIGIGLVQFRAIWEHLYQSAVFAAAFVAGKAETKNIVKIGDTSYDPDLSSPYFFALIVTALVAGCIFCYLETRTRLTLLFVGAENALDRSDIRQLREAAERQVTEGGPGAPGKLLPATSEDKEVAQLPRDALESTTELMGWASAKARTGHFQVAEDALRDALQRDPDNADVALRIADVRHLRGNHSGAFDVIMELAKRTTNEATRFELKRQALGSALYLTPPRSFEEAIALSDELLKGPRQDAMINVWRAAAFGQKYRSLKQDPRTPPDQLSEARREALAAVERAIELAPSYNSDERQLLREIYAPDREGSDPTESDLEIFKGDNDFERLIYRGKPQGGG